MVPSFSKIICCFLFTVLIVSSDLLSQETDNAQRFDNQSTKDFPFRSIQHISSEDGLSSIIVRRILQSRDGFMWFATLNGLNRYDGHQFRSWSYDANNANSLAYGSIYGLIEDPNGILWIAHHKEGV